MKENANKKIDKWLNSDIRMDNMNIEEEIFNAFGVPEQLMKAKGNQENAQKQLKIFLEKFEGIRSNES
ncbi:MAG: hypothetical protein E7I48_18230 [Clostridium celatum]|nr:hypothetical protein [Clostridium celatum]